LQSIPAFQFDPDLKRVAGCRVGALTSTTEPMIRLAANNVRPVIGSLARK
jgi:hypothetical protein